MKFKIEKKEFHKSKKPIDLNLIDINKIVPQMSGFIKYFDGNRKNIFKEK